MYYKIYMKIRVFIYFVWIFWNLYYKVNWDIERPKNGGPPSQFTQVSDPTNYAVTGSNDISLEESDDELY